MKRTYTLGLLLNLLLVGILFAGIKDKLGIGVNVNSQRLYGDNLRGDFVFGGSPLILRYNFKPKLFLDADLGFSKLSTPFAGTTLETEMINIGLKLGYRFFHENRFNPIIYVGGGAFNFKQGNSQRFWDGYAAAGAGAEFFITNFLGLNVSGDYRYTTGDDFDGSRLGKGKDAFVNVAGGVVFYFGGRTRGEPHYVEERPDLDYLFDEVEPEKDIAEGVVDLVKEETNGHYVPPDEKPVESFTPYDDVKIEPLDEPDVSNDQPEPARTSDVTDFIYTVKPGDWLSKIAARYYGDPFKYTEIAEANWNVINDPDLIYPGTELKLPNVDSDPNEPINYTVQPGDWLSKIAARFYGDPFKYTEITDANWDVLSDPDRLVVGQVLRIPARK